VEVEIIGGGGNDNICRGGPEFEVTPTVMPICSAAVMLTRTPTRTRIRVKTRTETFKDKDFFEISI